MLLLPPGTVPCDGIQLAAVVAAAGGGCSDVGAGSSRKATSVSGDAGSGTHQDVEEFAAVGRPSTAAEVAGAVDFDQTNVVNSRDVGSVVAAASVDSFLGMVMPWMAPVGTNFAAVVVNYSRCCCCCCCLFDGRWCLDWVSWVVQPASAVVPPRRREPNPVSEAGLPRTPVYVGRAI